MNTPLDRYAEHFEQLRLLPLEQHEAALAALPLSPRERDLLRDLLTADTDAGDPLAQVLADSAGDLMATRVQRLGPWHLLREIGVGGMGTVFLAERVDGGFAQRVAIKLLRGFPTREGLQRLRHERQILADLDHPHIARLLDGGETADGQPWLALEYVDGLPLLAHAATHAPRLRERLALFDAVLDAVGHAHQRLVIHRDIKPANVLVTTGGDVKLVDFGIARLLDLDTGQARRDTSTRVFTLGYASPEQREGRAITTASDIYSLGVLLRELIAGEGVGRDAPAALPLDAELGGIIAKATAADPADRYASASALREDLERYREGRPVRAARVTRWYRMRKFVGRHRGAVALAALAVGIMLASWSYALQQAHEARLQAARAARHFAGVRDLANRFIGTVFQQIVDVPGTSQAQRTLLDTGVEYLDRLAADSGDNPELLLDIATGYASLAKIRKRMYAPPAERIATAERALAAVDHADRLVAPQAHAQALRLSALTELGDAQADAQQGAAAQATLARAAALARAAPAADETFALAIARGGALYVQARAADAALSPAQSAALYAEAGTACERARALASTEAERVAADGLLASALSFRAYSHAGDDADPEHMAKALVAAERGLQVQESLLARHPQDLRHLVNAASAAGIAARMAERSGQFDAARAHYQRRREIDRELLRLDPAQPIAAVNRIVARLQEVQMEARAGSPAAPQLQALAEVARLFEGLPAELARQRQFHLTRAWFDTLKAEFELRRSGERDVAAAMRLTLLHDALRLFEEAAAQVALVPEMLDDDAQEAVALLRSGPARVHAALTAQDAAVRRGAASQR